MKVVLVYPPFCPPTVMPYSISSLKGFLNHTGMQTKCIDLNARLHKMMLPSFYQKLKESDLDTFPSLLEEFEATARPLYAANNKRVVRGEKPDFVDELLRLILEEKPGLVAFSLVYSSQCFYATILLGELGKRGIKCVAGGPATSDRIKQLCTYLENVDELNAHVSKLENIPSIPLPKDAIPDFSDYDQQDYFVIEPIIPLKSSSTCYYKKCAFCTHFTNIPYREIDLNILVETIKQSKAKRFFFIDDMIPKGRLVRLATALTPLNITWWVQLKPTIDLIDIFPALYDSGLRAISWGIESASQRILDLMEKGTKVHDIASVLKASHDAKIKNTAYIIFGFPSESKEEFMDTINFLKTNKESLDLVSTSIFGLHQGSRIYEHPQKFGITRIIHTKRKLLDDSITYEVASGLDKESANRLRQRFRSTLRSINKMPQAFKDYKEQVLLLP